MMHSTAFLPRVRPGYQTLDGRSIRRRLVDAAARPVDGSSLAFSRIVFGLVVVLSAVRTLGNGWVESLYAGPDRRFSYPLLGWVPQPSVPVAYGAVVAVAVGGLIVAIGWRPKLGLALVWPAFTWLEFVDATTYLNHYWFVTLFGIVLLAAPCGEELGPRARHRPIAAGWLWLARTQVAVVYVFAGLAKLNADWLFHALPLRLWLPTRSDVPLIGPLLERTPAAFVLSWAGALFDCTIVALLLWRRTRLWAWFAVVVFHVATWRIFSIGVFPWLMIGVTTLYFAPDWPRRFVPRRTSHSRAATPPERLAVPRLVPPAAIAWVALQLLVPLRQHVIPGNAAWTGEGYRLSWQVLLVEKGGWVTFRVTDTENGVTTTTTGADLYTPLQWKVMSTEPDLIRQAAHAIAASHGADGQRVEVRADAFVSLNGRRAARLVDPDVNLAAEPWRWHQSWILPSP